MKLNIETGKVRWSSVRLAVFCMILGAAIGGLIVLTAPTQVNCRLLLPDGFQIPSAS